MNREKIALAADWKFRLGDCENADYMGFDDGEWQSVTVPHDWAVKNPFSKEYSSGTGYVCGGTAWYRKHFALGDVKGKRVYITFEGVYNNSRVWINSNYLGKRPYGYATFTYDISEFVREGENVVSVKVSHECLADSRWYTGSGITRPVYLTITDEAAIVPNGIKITTPFVSGEKAVVEVEASATKDGLGFRYGIIDKDGIVVASTDNGRLEIEKPELWSVDSPCLYTLRTEVFDGGAVTDSVDTIFGIREFYFDADKGFFLNGAGMKLKGVCVHHDAGCLGAAVPKSVWRSRLETLKECGCNAIRTSHNPPDPALLDLCDEMGFLVMDEAFDEWEGPKNKWWQGHNVYPPKHGGYSEDFPEWGEKDIKMMVRRDRNHPSIIMWSIGNEIDYPNDPYVHPLFNEVMGNNDANKPARERIYDPKRPDAGRLAKIAKRLVAWVKEEDTTRPVTAALAFPELSNETGYADELDIVGYNYKEQFYEADHKRFAGRVIFGSENSHGPHAWNAVRDNDYICGQFLWTGIDYMGEAHGWPVRCSGAGLLDMAGFKKPNFYMRKALWRDEPYAMLACHRLIKPKPGDRRPPFAPPEPKWSFGEGERVRVICFTNQTDGTLLLNGRSLGAGKPEFGGDALAWELEFEKGKLEFVSEKASAVLETSGKAVAIKVKASGSDDDNVVKLEISLVDECGRIADTDASISAAVTDGELMGLENGDIADCTSYTSLSRRTRHGRLAAYVRTSGKTTVRLTCRELGFEKQINL